MEELCFLCVVHVHCTRSCTRFVDRSRRKRYIFVFLRHFPRTPSYGLSDGLSVSKNSRNRERFLQSVVARVQFTRLECPYDTYIFFYRRIRVYAASTSVNSVSKNCDAFDAIRPCESSSATFFRQRHHRRCRSDAHESSCAIVIHPVPAICCSSFVRSRIKRRTAVAVFVAIAAPPPPVRGRRLNKTQPSGMISCRRAFPNLVGNSVACL